MEFKEYWDSVHKKYGAGEIGNDNWLDKYLDLLKKSNTPILDLGCGAGADTNYLLKHDMKVIACDYSEVGLNLIQNNINLDKKVLDIINELPFDNETFDVIIADLSLHYFTDVVTKKIMKEIKRILKKEGCLLARVNTVDDINYGARNGIEIEKNYYFTDGYNKRFFTEEDIDKYFSIIGNVDFFECQMFRYIKPKKVYEIKVIKKIR